MSKLELNSDQELSFQDFIKHKIGNNELEDITIYAMNNEFNDNQIWFQFKNNYDNILSMLCIYFKDYIKKNDKFIRISSFGYKEKIISKVIFKELTELTPLNNTSSYLINIGTTAMPSVEDSFLYKIDKTLESFETNNNCPVCLVEMETSKYDKVSLKCGHFICRDCLFRSIENNLTNCPLCRQNLFTN